MKFVKIKINVPEMLVESLNKEIDNLNLKGKVKPEQVVEEALIIGIAHNALGLALQKLNNKHNRIIIAK